MNMNLKQKRNDSNCNFYYVSLLIPYPNKFLVVCLCILIFDGIYLPPPPQPQIFFVLWETNILFGRGGWVIFFHKAINDQSCKLKNK